MRYTFDRCSVDASSREITLDGTATDMLIEARPCVVSKAEVMLALSPDTFVLALPDRRIVLFEGESILRSPPRRPCPEGAHA